MPTVRFSSITAAQACVPRRFRLHMLLIALEGCFVFRREAGRRMTRRMAKCLAGNKWSFDLSARSRRRGVLYIQLRGIGESSRELLIVLVHLHDFLKSGFDPYISGLVD